MSVESSLRVKNLKAGYADHVVLESVDLEMAKGEIRIVLGGSGCGKSTLLKNVAGLERPLGGTIELLGRSIDWSEGLPPGEMFEKIGILFQGAALLSSLTVGENVSLPLRIRDPGINREDLKDLVARKLAQVKMTGTENKLPGELSGGMRKRVGLARALATDPEFLFCDEPSAGLDPVTSRQLDDLLLELRGELGISMFIVTHELRSIRALADRITFLSGGRVIFEGTLKEAETGGPPEVLDFLSEHSGDAKKSGGVKV